MRQHLRTVIALAAAVGLLALFLRNTDFRDVATEIARARVGLLLLALVDTAATYVFRALRWQYLLVPIGRVHFGTRSARRSSGLRPPRCCRRVPVRCCGRTCWRSANA